MNNNKSKKSISVVLFTSISVLFVSIFIIVVTSVFITVNIATGNYSKNNFTTSANKVDDTLSEILYSITATHVLTFNDEGISEFSLVDDNSKQVYFENLYKNGSINNENYVGMSLYFEDKTYISSQAVPFLGKTEIDAVNNSSNYMVYVSTISSSDESMIVFGKKVQYSLASESVGVAFYYLKESVILKVLDLINVEGSETFLVTNDAYGVAHPNEELNGIYLYNFEFARYLGSNSVEEFGNYNGKYSIFSLSSMHKTNYAYDLDFTIVSATPFYSVYGSIIITYLIVGIIALISLALSITFGILISKKIINPLISLSHKVGEYSPLQDTILTKVVDNKNEVYILEESYDLMMDRIRNLMNQSIRDMETKRNLELETLQMQINPHFLYNTLDAIAWMAKFKDEKDIEQLVIELSKFYRVSLHKGAKFIKVSEEMEIIDHFMKIELVRFPNKFTYDLNIDEDVKNAQTLKLILQPIVENAIKHGLASLNRIGHIDITVSRSNDNIIFIIKDDGVGFDFDDSSFLDRKNDPSYHGGYGLYNVQERIHLEYGSQYGIEVDSIKDRGTKVIVKIPFIYHSVD